MMPKREMASGKGIRLVMERKTCMAVDALVYCMACLSIPALAGPPYRTDDPEPVEYQHHEFYIATQQIKTADGRAGTLPHFEFNYGSAPDVMLHIIAPVAFSSPADGPRQRGLGDVEFGVKYRFMQETDSRPMVGTFPILVTHTGNADKGLGNGDTQIFLPIWLQKKWGEWQSYGGGGYWINRAPDTKNYWFFGWQVQKELSEHLTLGGEIFHNTEQVAGQGSSTGFNLGGSYNFDEHKHLLFSAGKGLTNVDNTNKFSSYVGYQWTW
ncbi:transporter [Sulfuricella sp.]|uniref:transporter n=1 Tax=Sulfuricella sp. TaxID=2099377 RepID=UPI002C5158F2|nr:transporter [Sulfuricella sp.]HUX64063.1 transporter [Sulfuricella sp.]